MKPIFLRIFAGLVFVGITAGVLATSLNSASHIVTIDDLAQTIQNKESRTRIRAGGRVTKEPITYRLEPTILLTFHVVNPNRENDPTAPSILVRYPGLKPDMLEAGRDVLIDGNIVGGVFEATKLLTQCPSKYNPPAPGDRGSSGKMAKPLSESYSTMPRLDSGTGITPTEQNSP